MAKIKVVRGGCGISCTDEHGVKRYMTKTAEDGPFEYEEDKAARLVSLGVAVYVEEKKVSEGEKPERTEMVSALVLSELTVKELAAMAEEKGIDVSKCKKKADYVTAIMEASDKKKEYSIDGKEDRLPGQEELLQMSIDQLEQTAIELGIDTDDFEDKEEYVDAILTVTAQPGKGNSLPPD